jgi:predicted phosphodiesterase
MSKVLVLSDIHHKWERAEKIIAAESPDLTVFLGDFQDDYGDNPRIARETALWLKKSVHERNRIHLMGNHDAPYRFHNNFMYCSGYLPDKDDAINMVMKEEDWAKLKWFYIHDGILFSHAGVSASYLKLRGNRSVETFLTQEANAATKAALNPKTHHWFFVPGMARGGAVPVGGLTWCDFSEFEPTKGIRQVMGHTPMKKPTWLAGENLFLDTHLNDYAVLKNGEITTKLYSDL